MTRALTVALLMVAVLFPASANAKKPTGGADRQDPIATDTYLAWSGAQTFTHPSDVWVERRTEPGSPPVRVNKRPFDGSLEGCKSRYQRSHAKPLGLHGDRVLYMQSASVCGPERPEYFVYDLASKKRTRVQAAFGGAVPAGLWQSWILYAKYSDPESLDSESRLILLNHETGERVVVAKAESYLSPGQIAGDYLTYALYDPESETYAPKRYDLLTRETLSLPGQARPSAILPSGTSFYSAFEEGECRDCPGPHLFELSEAGERSVAELPCPAQELYANETAGGVVEVFYVASDPETWCDPQHHKLFRAVVEPSAP